MSAPGPATPVPTGPIGRTIHGRYEIKRLLGEGGMGGVYEGEHLELGKRVAIKLVHALHARDPHVAARIKQEARSIGAIESENIVQVFDAGEDPELGIFLVMEMLKGEDLARILARRRRVSPTAAATVVMQAAHGLSRAHAIGVVHRDLKPANIFVCTRDDGRSLVKLVDFGIAKIVRDATQASRTPGLTQAGMAIGTPQYMSPEQVQGLASVDHRTDIYSLGAVLYEACVGASPYPEMPTYEQTILQIMTRPAPRLSSAIPDVHPELDRLCADMMAHDASARPPDMATVRERLARIFPEIEGSPRPTPSLAHEIQLEGFPVSLPAGSLRGTRSSLSPVAEQQAPDDVAGLPSRRRGARVGALAVLALLAGFCVLALTRVHAAPPPSTAPATFGLVQSTVFVPAPAEPSATVAPSSTPAPPVASAAAPSVVPTPSSRPARSPAPARRKAPPTQSSAPPVGGTSESTEF